MVLIQLLLKTTEAASSDGMAVLVATRRELVERFHGARRTSDRPRRVLLTGIAGNICVLFTANDAYMREYWIFAPADCIVSNTASDNDHALRQLNTVLKGNVALSTRLRFQAGRRTARRRVRAE